MGTRSVEQVAEVSGEGRRWFQLYLWKDRRASGELVRRAGETGYDTLLVTADTPVAGLRLRDTRNGMTIPPKLRLSTVLDASYRPEWWLNFLSTDPLSFASLSGSGASLPEVINSMFEPTLDFEDLEWICSVWPGKLFLKGVLGVEDALGAVAASSTACSSRCVRCRASARPSARTRRSSTTRASSPARTRSSPWHWGRTSR